MAVILFEKQAAKAQSFGLYFPAGGAFAGESFEGRKQLARFVQK